MKLELPRHLAPWARELAIFPSEMALTLGGLVARLAGLIGEGTTVSSEQGEPDGYDGIARKGTYDRLLPAEWLLFDEIPEEFLRRVVESEHVFLKRAFSHQAGAKRCVALFDTSADQLGAPRLAHLAVLVLLAQRANARGASFEWAVIQDAPSSLRTGITPASVLELLHSRGRRPVHASDLDRWASAFDKAAPSEWWLVGAQAIEHEAVRLRASSISAADVLDPFATRIVVRATTPSARKSKEIALDIPDNRAAVRLLRDPFSAAAPVRRVAPRGITPDSTMVFSLSSRLLYVQTTLSSLVSVDVPSSVRAAVRPPATFEAPEGHRIHAVGYSISHKRTVVVSSDADGAFVAHCLSKRGASANSTEHYAAPKTERPELHGPLQPLGVFDQRRLGFTDGNGRLLELFDDGAAFRETGRILRTIVSPYGFGWLEIYQDSPRMMWMTTTSRGPTPHEERLPAPVPRFGAIQNLCFAGGIFAYTTTEGSWDILYQNRRTSLPVEVPSQIPAVVRHSSSEVGLLAFGETQTRIDFITDGRRETLVTTSAPVASVVVSGRATEFAYLTETGELGIYRMSAKALVTRLDGDPS